MTTKGPFEKRKHAIDERQEFEVGTNTSFTRENALCLLTKLSDNAEILLNAGDRVMRKNAY